MTMGSIRPRFLGYWLGVSLLLVGCGLIWLLSTGVSLQSTQQEAAPINRSISFDGPTSFDDSTFAEQPITPLPQSIDLDSHKVELGRRLFQDVGLSSNKKMSCATCHRLDQLGVDGQPKALGADGQFLDRNTPTVFNSGYNFRQFWDGRANSLEEQVDAPLLSPREMDNTWSNLIAYLSEDPGYRDSFKQAYKDVPNERNVRDAIATFQRSLITPNARFDKYLRGKSNVLTTTEKQGYQLFKDYGCVACHQGVNIGGNLYQRLGVVQDYFASRETTTANDLGRFNLTQRPRDLYVFKVPSLRNVELTAPYLHDGSLETLEETVSVMAIYQLGRNLSDSEIAQIVAFLKTLTGAWQT